MTGEFRVQCNMCESIHTQLLEAQNPFDSEDVVFGCPTCRYVNDFTTLCDVPECRAPVSCGTLTLDGYRNTCGEHRPMEAVR